MNKRKKREKLEEKKNKEWLGVTDENKEKEKESEKNRKIMNWT